MTEQIPFERIDWIFQTGPWIWAIFALVDVSKCLDIFFDFGIFTDVDASSILTWVSPDTASAACLAHPCGLDFMSMTFEAVIWDADDY